MELPDPMNGDLSRTSRLVIITGAAGAIGGATVRAFLNAGFRVVGFDRSDSVMDLADQNYSGIVVDLADEPALSQAFADACVGGTVHHVVGIAGGALPEEPQMQDDPRLLPIDVFRSSLDANLVTQYAVVRAALPWLRQDHAADRSISFTSSVNALTGSGMPGYSAAKAGLIGMMHALTPPLGAEGIRVNVVAPGSIWTPRTERIWGHSSKHFERLTASTAMGRLATAGEVANAFLALATMLTGMTGQILTVDCGQMVKRSWSPAAQTDSMTDSFGSRLQDDSSTPEFNA